MYCNDSVSYCDIDANLIDDVEKNAAEFGYPKIAVYCGQRLNDALQELNDASFKKLPKTDIANIVMFIGELTDIWRGCIPLLFRTGKGHYKAFDVILR
ncbi:hypothetical protein [Xenorhabdus bharatensis]|uniref:hypothetical protein n=1 Tax=Xenorhabdus bharatensis TaxID=3136256 RepID=UPI0030F3FCE4